MPAMPSMLWIVLSAILAIAVAVLLDMRLFSRKDHFPVEGRTVVITGGSQGMGRGVARLLAQKGANVVLVARGLDKLEATIEYIRAAAAQPNDQRFHFISADMTDASECTRVVEEVKAWNHDRSPDIVWCVAGAAYPELFIRVDATRLQDQMNQNYFSAAFMAHAVLRDWLQPANTSTTAKPRHLIFTSSLAAFYSMVGYTAYTPAKTALRALSDGLAQEVKLYNGAKKHKSGTGPAAEVKIHTVFPGTIYTAGYEQEKLTKPGVTAKLEEDDTGQTEDEVAAASLKGLQNGEYLVTTALLGSIMRGAAWASSPRHNPLADTVVSLVSNVAWLFVQPDHDAKVTKWGAEHGHPATYNGGG